ncbi:hypothetical protein L486_02402 [Kwoniella mangroviensis CBS 10435]|uniref:BAG domain-containing protein n=1 Tax=Kwoniella mangroviensis CBS 10435 TaxID=1331196 RepID=A0A1B9IW16_9TREE|nr:hypothetical protein L486_02402 [Kwoniella mangroviensis CBS 10435]
MFPHPYFTHPAQQRREFATPSPSYSYPHPQSHQQFNFFPQPSPPTPTYDYSSIEEEERAALAHLRSIQRRREEAEAAAAREAAIAREAAARVEREAAIRTELARLERQRQIAQAIRAQQQAEEERRKRAYLEAIERKRAKLLNAQLAAQARRQAAIAAGQARRDEAEARRRACTQARCQRRSPPAAVPTTSRSSTPSAERNEWQELNNIFGPLFGLHLVPDAESPPLTTAETTFQPRSAPEQPKPEAQQSAPAPSAPASTEKKDKKEFPEDINKLLSQFLGLRVDPISESESSSSTNNAKAKDNGTPEGLNGLLGQFGLVFEPEASETEEKKDDTPAPAAPEKKKSTPVPSTSFNVAQPSTVATEKEEETPAQKEVPPFTSLLDQFTDLNPFLRDLLGNFEHALTEELTKKNKTGSKDCQGTCENRCAQSCGEACATEPAKKYKGKARAEGERKEGSKPVPAPTPASVPVSTPATVDSTDSTNSSSSITALDSIESQLESLRSSFTFPPRLSFAHSTSETVSPPLLFNKTNSAYHTQANSYLQLLLKADGISSNGDKEIRKRRKELVRKVEQEIEQLEKQKDEIWESVKAKRDNGEESESDEVDERSWSGSETTSVIGDNEHLQQDQNHEHEHEIEHVENKEEENEHKSYAEVAKPNAGNTSDNQNKEEAVPPVEGTASTIEQPFTPHGQSDVQPETSANDAQPESTPATDDQSKEEIEGYTISITFPTEVEPAQEQSSAPEPEEKKDNVEVEEKKEVEAETETQSKRGVTEEDKRSDKSARVETEEEGYELV